jgi:hypothetical protein
MQAFCGKEQLFGKVNRFPDKRRFFPDKNSLSANPDI